jgi:hydroxymethylbilane synthase
VNALAGRSVEWVRLTHLRQGFGGQAREGGASANVIATYEADTELPSDLPERSHFFWMSGSLFTKAIERWPALREGWHASGPGRTHQVIAAALGPGGRTGVWLDRESWERDICL